MLIFPISALDNKFDPQNIACMPVAKFIFRLELEKIFCSVTTCRIMRAHNIFILIYPFDQKKT
jgi:hypothetical protein